MANTKDEYKECFNTYDQYLKGEISWDKVDMTSVLKHSSLTTTMSEVDDIFKELGIDGEDRVFGTDASKSSSNFLHSFLWYNDEDGICSGASKFAGSFLDSSFPEYKESDFNADELKENTNIINQDGEGKETESQFQMLEKPIEENKIMEDWVVINDITDDEN